MGGFALAGGYAVQAHGLARRASKDVDLFTTNSLAMDFDAARDRIIDALRADGWVVSVERTSDTFARLVVTDESTNQDAVMELAVDWRAHDPVRLELGPVLHPDDAIANKMSALFGRAMARDYIDVDSAIATSRYTRSDLLKLAHERDVGLSAETFADALAAMTRLDDAEFAAYEMNAGDIAAMRARFADWWEELVGDVASSSG